VAAGAGGRRAALASKGATGTQCELSPAQLCELDALPDARPTVRGYADQCWTLARISELAWHRFRVEYTLAGLDAPLRRTGWSVQVPVGRPVPLHNSTQRCDLLFGQASRVGQDRGSCLFVSSI
jgi:hypothetical protein